MNKREQVITDCFQSWLTKDAETFCGSFSEDAVYIESWGPAYRGLKHIARWFDDWNNADNFVLKWDIANFFHDEKVSVCEWYFECKCDSVVAGFNGVSLVTFNSEDKIVLLKEFQSKTPNEYPYE